MRNGQRTRETAMAQYYMGIDGGGTRSRARLEDSAGRVLSTAQSGAANIVRDIETAKASILDLCQQALKNAGLAISPGNIVVGAGLAGANVPDAKRRMEAWSHPFADFQVVSDLHAACLGAHGGDEGAVIVCGTGSSATRYINGQFQDIGGHGFLVGDAASGAWLGLHAVQHTLLCLDKLQAHDALADAVCDYMQVNEGIALVEKISGYQARDYGGLAPLVTDLYREQEPSSSALIHRGAAYLSRVAGRLLHENTLSLVLSGGLVETYISLLPENIASRVCEPLQTPEQGAIALVKSKQAARGMT